MANSHYRLRFSKIKKQGAAPATADIHQYRARRGLLLSCSWAGGRFADGRDHEPAGEKSFSRSSRWTFCLTRQMLNQGTHDELLELLDQHRLTWNDWPALFASTNAGVAPSLSPNKTKSIRSLHVGLETRIRRAPNLHSGSSSKNWPSLSSRGGVICEQSSPLIGSKLIRQMHRRHRLGRLCLQSMCWSSVFV